MPTPTPPSSPLPTRIAALALALLALLTLPACIFAPPPTFALVGATPAESTEDGAVIRFDLQAANDSDLQLPLREAKYTLTLDGVRVFTGARSAETSLRPYGTQPLSLPASISAESFDLSRLDRPGEEIPYRLTGSIEYLTPGQLAEVFFDSGLRRTKAPLDVEGVLVIDGSALGLIPITPTAAPTEATTADALQ